MPPLPPYEHPTVRSCLQSCSPTPLLSIDSSPLPLSSSIPTRKFPSPQTLPPPANRTTLSPASSLRSSSPILFVPHVDLAVPGSILGRPLHSSCWHLFSQLVDEPPSSLVSQHLRHLDREGGGVPRGGKGSVVAVGGTSTRLLAPSPYINHTDSADCDKKRKSGGEGGREGGSGA